MNLWALCGGDGRLLCRSRSTIGSARSRRAGSAHPARRRSQIASGPIVLGALSESIVEEEQQSRRPPAAGNPKGRAALRPPSVSLVVSDRLRKIASSSLLDGGPNSALRGSRGFFNRLLWARHPPPRS